MAASITLSSLSVGMDDGGKFPYQYSYVGFILGPIVSTIGGQNKKVEFYI